jgi:hypothetical protein
MTCPECRDTGMITRPYIAGVVSVMTVCHCAAGKAQLEHINKQMEAKNDNHRKSDRP